MKKLFSLLIILMTLFGSCKKEVNSPVIEVTPEMARDSLYFIMKEVYYWYNLMPTVTRENYSDPYSLLDAMMYKTLDRWSFVADYDAFNAEMQGTFVGHGFRIGLDVDSVARIAMIYKNSQLYFSGVRRGWIVKKINGTDVAPLLAHDMPAYYALIGPSTSDITNTFLFQKPDGSEVTISATKSSFTINSVLLYDTLLLSTGDVAGHLVFESFIEPSEKELETAFSYFKTKGAKELILDLRYNSGGYLYIAQELASYIAGNGYTSTNFGTLQYNDKYQSVNRSYKFITTNSPLALSRIVVITTRSTASASEVVMNSLKPFTTIVSIGDTTNGKPVGMNAFPCAEKYIFSPITFKIINSLSQGDYFDGFAPQIIATDDITHDFDDNNEKCLKEAIQYLETGILPGKSPLDFHRSAQFSEKPSWMNNTFVKGEIK
jgi:C-terminal processing protease CtpA/Prc